MPKIRIPSSGHIAFRNLLALTEDQFGLLLKTLTHAPAAGSRDTYWKHVSQELPDIKSEILHTITDELFALSSARDNMGLSIDEFVRLIGEAAATQKDDEKVLSENEVGKLRVRLAQLLESKDSLALTSKALDVLTDAERVYYSARILTDVRPLFDESGRKIEASVIVHNLHIHFGKDDEHRDFFVLLDTNDVKDLRNVLDRADKKAESLQQMLRNVGLPYLAVDK
jgi:hypothetical protein